MAAEATSPVWQRSMDALLVDLVALKSYSEQTAGNAMLTDFVTAYQNGDYKAVLASDFAQNLFEKSSLSSSEDVKPLDGDVAGSWNHSVLRNLLASTDPTSESVTEIENFDKKVHYLRSCALLVGLAAFDAFLQANVTGPPLSFSASSLLVKDADAEAVRQQCLDSLAMDGISVYQYIPKIELFCLARTVFCDYFPRTSGLKKGGSEYEALNIPESYKAGGAQKVDNFHTLVYGQKYDTKWMRIRLNAYHQRLLTGVKLGDSPSELQVQIEADLAALEKEIFADDSTFTTEAKVQFLLERAQIYIMQGMDLKAKSNVERAKEVSKFSYALSGALGKRTKFQEKDTSQLVVYAKSHITPELPTSKDEESNSLTVASEVESGTSTKTNGGPAALDLNDDTLLESIAFKKSDTADVLDPFMPKELAGLEPDNQPQLQPLDQIILLTEATLKDTLSPLDKLSREEILPFAVRVLTDKPSNWQVYTQALLVRSRIESHRSRTMERSVLQLQAIVDQIIADTENEESTAATDGVPQIQVTQFFPRAKANESAPVTERLKYIFQLNTPTRWEVEAELAFAWSKAGSLVTALEIFKRLRLWAEVALCYHSVNQESRARQIVARQLYYSKKGPEMDKYDIDAEELLTEEWDGEMRSPPPPHAPRLWCILGDLDQDPGCWNRAWEISNNRFARAQRTLGEYWTRQGNLELAREAYIKATVVNRQNEETWSRLGDIDLRGGNWDGAIIAFQQSIMIDDTDAKTYSNLGSALLSKHAEMLQLEKLSKATENSSSDDEDELAQPTTTQSPRDVLRQALIAYKRGASIAHDNWKIWDNVITIGGRMSPPSYPEVLQGMRNVIRIRGPTIGEEAVDAEILRALITQLSTMDRPDNTARFGEIYMPARGSLARAVIEMVDADVVPLITARPELWSLVEKLAIFRQDWAGALSCAEKSWRMATAGEVWLEDKDAWKAAANATDALAAALESYGPMEKVGEDEVVEKGWKLKARQAVRSIIGKSKDIWDGTEEFEMLKERLEELKGL